MAEPTEEQIKEAREVGISRGWSHQNYISAYGSKGESNKPDYPGWLNREVIDTKFRDGTMTAAEHSTRISLRAVFADAWKEGRELYRNNRWQDGSSRDDE